MFRSLYRIVRILPVLMLAFYILPAYSQILDNKGKEFIMSFLPNFDASVTIQLHLTGDVGTMVTVEYPVNSPTFTTTVAVTPGAITIVPLPITPSTGWTAGVVQNNSVRAYSPTNDEFVAYMINIRPFSSDAALALPIDTYNTEFIALTYHSNIVSADRSMFVVTAAFNNTTVTITPTKTLEGGFPAGVPFNITLNKGQGFLARGTTFGAAGDLSGSIVQADKPVTMTNGNICTNVPPNQTFCDHIFEVAHPTQTWGNQALVANLINNPNGAVYRILASQDNTTVTEDGAFIATLNRGQFIDTGLLPGNHEFAADKPIFVAQYMTGVNPGFGDPAMGNMVPPDQYQNAYTFSTVGGGQFAQHFVNIIAKNSDVGSVLLNGSPVSAGSFTAIGSTGYSTATISIPEGTHNTSSPNGHGIEVYGVNEDDSYIYVGGALFQFINPVGDANPPVCTINISGNMATGVVTDSLPSEDINGNGILDPGEDLNGNGQIDEDTGVFFVVLEPGSVNLLLTVAPFTPGDPVVTYTVTLINPALPGFGVVKATDGAGNTCTSPVQLGGVPNDPPVCAVSPPGPFTVPEGTPISFQVSAFDPNNGDVITLSSSSLPSGASMNPPLPHSGPNSGIFSVFNWTPGPGQAGNYTIIYTVTDNLNASSQCTVQINVTPGGVDLTKPSCDIVVVPNSSPKALNITLSDAGSGVANIKVQSLSNATLEIPYGSGNFYTKGQTVVISPPQASILARATKINNSKSSTIVLKVTDAAGNSVTCDPVYSTISEVLPEGFDLQQNYPNPFNPSTTIRFSVASLEGSNNFLTLKIYDLTGQEVKTLINEMVAPGEYAVQWDATDNRGHRVAAGVYLYRITVGNFAQTRKMILAK